MYPRFIIFGSIAQAEEITLNRYTPYAPSQAEDNVIHSLFMCNTPQPQGLAKILKHYYF